MNRYQLQHIDHWVIKPGQVWYWTDDPQYEVTIIRSLGYVDGMDKSNSMYQKWAVKGNAYYESNNFNKGETWYTEEGLTSGFTLKPEKKSWLSKIFK